MSDLIVGIDLGTTNSEVATFVEDHVQVLGSEKNNMLPSVVGLSPSGELLVGEPARNQLVLYPERTVRSIKRKMGSNETVTLGDRQFTPPEISALILRKLAAWASRSVQQPIHKAVITVPAYFSDAQRQATREAAALADLEAIRILNEPTAASLAYGEGTRHTAMVYDLGGGTFDVSIVALEGDITEVLASHGNNQLGGDDFNDLLAEHLLAAFQSKHGIDLRQGDMDAILLVGGSTRTPLVSRMLHERTGLVPREEIHPDLCVALGAGVLASRLAGHEVERVLVDVSPYSFGVSYLGERGGVPYPYCYKPIIRRNSPLPLTRTERFYTSAAYQETVEICVYEGEDEDALKNILVGDFQVQKLKPVRDASEVLCRMSVDLDGILHVTAIEKCTGRSKHITIAQALEAKSEADIAEARRRLEALYATRSSDGVEQGERLEAEMDEQDEEESEEIDPESDGGDQADTAVAESVPANGFSTELSREGRLLVERSRQLLDQMHEEDREEVIDLSEQIETAIAATDETALKSAAKELRELLFFVEGKQ